MEQNAYLNFLEKEAKQTKKKRKDILKVVFKEKANKLT